MMWLCHALGCLTQFSHSGFSHRNQSGMAGGDPLCHCFRPQSHCHGFVRLGVPASVVQEYHIFCPAFVTRIRPSANGYGRIQWYLKRLGAPTSVLQEYHILCPAFVTCIRPSLNGYGRIQ